MNIRKQIEAEFDEESNRAPALWTKERGRRNWIIDFWVAYDIRSASKTINLNRYRNDPEASEAIHDLRIAAEKAMRILNRNQGRS